MISSVLGLGLGLGLWLRSLRVNDTARDIFSGVCDVISIVTEFMVSVARINGTAHDIFSVLASTHLQIYKTWDPMISILECLSQKRPVKIRSIRLTDSGAVVRGARFSTEIYTKRMSLSFTPLLLRLKRVDV